MYGALESVEWDEQKSARNRALRGFGFDFAAQVFLGDYIEAENRARDFGELRFVAIGSVDGLILTVIWTPRGANRRIMSSRPASKKERTIYHGHHKKEDL